MITCSLCDRVALHDDDERPLCRDHLVAELPAPEPAPGTLAWYVAVIEERDADHDPTEPPEIRLHDVTAESVESDDPENDS
jgi:hypothetical protein